MNDSIDVFDVKGFLSKSGIGKTIVKFRKGQSIFAQGDDCDFIFYVQSGTIKLTITSELGKEATIALLTREILPEKNAFRLFSPTVQPVPLHLPIVLCSRFPKRT